MSQITEKPLLMVFLLDMAAHYLRTLEFCSKIKDQFQIVFAHSPSYDKFVHRNGFGSFKVENFDSQEITSCASSFDFSWLSQSNVERIVDSQIAVIKEIRPSIVLGDAAFTLNMAAEKMGVPYVSLLNGYMTMFYNLTRKVSPSHPAYQYAKTIPAKVFDGLTRKIEQIMFRRIHAPFRATRKRLKITRRTNFLQELEGDLNLICDLPAFFPQKQLPENYTFVGPLFYRGQEEETEIRNFLADGGLSLLVSMGSTGNAQNLEFIHDSAFKEFRIVISGNELSFAPSENIFSRSFVNNVKIMDMIDIVVCHGGNGTVYQAISQGVPVLCFPNNFEQEWNVQRIADLGLGERLDVSCSPADIRRKVDTWIGRRDSQVFRDFESNIMEYIGKPFVLDLGRLSLGGKPV